MFNKDTFPIVYLMGPTASGKTPLAIELVQHFPLDIISVDSALVYKDMNIGTAKPTPAELQVAPHKLINILDAKEAYSAGQFCSDAIREIKVSWANGRIPLLVGGTMLYFRALQQGLAPLPPADACVRAKLSERAEQEGWEALHAELNKIDKEAAKRIMPRDSQRIQRALEVYLLTGKNITTWQKEQTQQTMPFTIHSLALLPMDRKQLHKRIELRFDNMLQQEFIAEVESLFKRGDLHADLPSIRAVGYRQAWDYLSGEINKEEMREQALAATRQLAKRQITWLRSWNEVQLFDTGEGVRQGVFDRIKTIVGSLE